MPNPLVSIITCAYRSDHTLRMAIESSLAQTFQDFEHIVLDDAHSADTETLVRSFNDSRLIYISNSSSLGISRNHLKGLENARAQRIAILNHDDFWDPRFLAEVARPVIEDPETTISFSDHFIVDAEGNVLKEVTEKCSKEFGRHLLEPGRQLQHEAIFAHQTIPLAIATVFNKEALMKTLDKDLYIRSGPSYDLATTIFLFDRFKQFYYCPERLSYYRIHTQAASYRQQLKWAEGSSAVWEFAIRNQSFQAEKIVIHRKLIQSRKQLTQLRFKNRQYVQLLCSLYRWMITSS